MTILTGARLNNKNVSRYIVKDWNSRQLTSLNHTDLNLKMVATCFSCYSCGCNLYFLQQHDKLFLNMNICTTYSGMIRNDPYFILFEEIFQARRVFSDVDGVCDSKLNPSVFILAYFQRSNYELCLVSVTLK